MDTAEKQPIPEQAQRRRLDGRRALVTGGASGIGRATAMRMAAEGAAVVVNYIGSAEPAHELIGELERDGGPVDLLVNNAGIEKPFPLTEMPLAEWRRVLDVNVTGAFLCAREAPRSLIAEGTPGVIVNVSSVHEVSPWPRFSHYCASKGAMKLFGQTIARELAPHRIRVVMVAPGAIVTPINKELIGDPEKRRQVEEQIPWGRMSEPEEVAAAIAWVAGPDAEYVTGSTIFVDGGMTLYPRFV